MITTHRASTGLIEKYIGTAYDNVKAVSEQIEGVKKLAEVIGEGSDFILLAQVLNNLGESVADLAALSQADLVAISDDLVKGNYLGNRKIDIDLALNNTSTESEVTYESAEIVTNQGIVINIPFTISDSLGNQVVQELASYTGIYNAIVNGIAEYNKSESNPQRHVVNTEIDIINSTLPNKPTMIRLRDADGQASSIDRIHLKVYSGDAVNANPAYFWAQTTSALQTLANRVGDIISLGNDIDSIVLLASQRDEIQDLYDNREILFGATDSLFSELSKLQDLHQELVKLIEVQSNLHEINVVYNNLNSVIFNEQNMPYIIAAEANANTAVSGALTATTMANAAEGYRDDALTFRNESEGFRDNAAASATLASNKNAEIKAITVAQTITGNSGTNASVIYSGAQNAFTFIVPKGDKGDRGDAFQVNAIGTSGQRVNYDSQNEGFSFLDSTNSLIYFKLSSAVGDWSTGSPFGKGDKGDTGNAGTSITEISFTSTTAANGLANQNGATDTYTISLSDGLTHTFNVKNGLNGAVLTVSGKTGEVVLTRNDVGLDQVNNTSDLNKPVSTATTTFVNNGLATKRDTWNNTTTTVNKTVVNNERLLVLNGGLTISLPASPVSGNTLIITAGNFTNTIVNRNGNNLMGLAENLVINKAYASIKLQYVNATQGWVLVA